MKKGYFGLLLIAFILLISGCGHMHNYDGNIIPPTCIEQGYTIYTCECGDVKKENFINALGHNFDEWVTTKEPTEENTGLKERYCKVCLYKQEEIVPIKNHEHTYIESKKEATCIEDGYIKKTCECGEYFVSEVIKANHTEETIEGKDATCEETGLTDGKKCLVCGKILVPQETIPLTKHNEIEIPSISATCTSYGYTKGSKCTICDVIIVEPTRTEMVEHTEETMEGKDATCKETGLTDGKKCLECGEILISQETIPLTKHNEIEIPSISATCTSYGYTKGSKCTVCDVIIVEPTRTEMVEHTEETIEGKDATCKETGLTDGAHCSVCEIIIIKQEVIEKKEHLIVTDPEIQPTCTQNGLTEGKHCEQCNEIIEEQKQLEVVNHEFDFNNNSCIYCRKKEYFEVKSELELKNADSSGKDMVIYMDYCISVEETNIYWTLYVAPETQYIRLVGTAGVQYNFCFDIDQARIEPLRIDLLNVSIKTLADKPIINSLSNTQLTIGLYGEKNQIIGKNGSNGFNGSLINFSYDGGRGSDGNTAINSNGDVTIYIESGNVVIKGGNGGNGGTGMSAVPAPQDGGNGGPGGDGAYAIRASSVTVQFAKGYNKSNLTLTGGNGGNGGSGGAGFLWGKDGKKGDSGKTALASNITINYE